VWRGLPGNLSLALVAIGETVMPVIAKCCAENSSGGASSAMASSMKMRQTVAGCYRYSTLIVLQRREAAPAAPATRLTRAR
jgi:hypothetical protein